MSLITDNIVKAIDTIVDSKIKRLKLDKTVQGLIVEIEDLTLGSYKVKIQNNIKIAYSIDPTAAYKEGDQVLVKIPENDMSNKLLIEKLVGAESTALEDKEYIIPLEATVINKEKEFTRQFLEDGNKLQVTISGYKKSGIELQPINKDYFTLLANGNEIFTFNDFLGNYYYKKLEIGIQETKIINFNYSKGQDINFVINSKEIEIETIEITPVREVSSAEIEYKGQIIQLENGGNSFIAKIYNKEGKDLTSLCNFKWFYYDSGWKVENNQNAYKIMFTKAYKNIAVQAFIDSHTIEVYKRENTTIPALNADKDYYCFVYNKYNSIDSSLLNQEYIIGELGGSLSRWQLALEENITLPFSLYESENAPTMIKNTWIDSYNRLHFQIKENYNINNYYNTFIKDDKRKEIFFEQEGDQGVHPEGYSCIIRPCDAEGNLTGSWYAPAGHKYSYYRVLFFKKGELQDANLFKVGNSSSVEYGSNFITKEAISIINNYITSTFQIGEVALSVITPLPYRKDDKIRYYPRYIKYNKSGFNPTYIQVEGFKETELELTSQVPRQFSWNDDTEGLYPALRFVSIENTASIEGWNGQSIETENNVIDSSQSGVGKVSDGKFTGMVLGIKGTNYGVYGYESGKETVRVEANGALTRFPGLNIYVDNTNKIVKMGLSTSEYSIELPEGTKIKVGEFTLDEYIKKVAGSK